MSVEFRISKFTDILITCIRRRWTPGKGALSVRFPEPKIANVFTSIGIGIGALSKKFSAPEFTDVFYPIGPSKGAFTMELSIHKKTR